MVQIIMNQIFNVVFRKFVSKRILCLCFFAVTISQSFPELSAYHKSCVYFRRGVQSGRRR